MKTKIFLSLLVVAAISAWHYSRQMAAAPMPDKPAAPSGGPGPAAPGSSPRRPPAIPDRALNAKVLAEVGLKYQQSVEPLLKQACFDCHSTATVFPWYHQLPGVAQYLDHHVEEARKRLDLSDGFPFKGRSPIVSRIRGIGATLKRGSMPLWDYKLMHAKARLTDDEKKAVTDWADESFQRLSVTAKPYTPQAATWPAPTK